MTYLRKVAFIYIISWTTLLLFWRLAMGTTAMNAQGEQILRPPSLSHFFGTDALGRDLWARTLEGGFNSLFVSLVASGLSLLVATAVGVIWTWFRPRSGGALLIMDLLQALPSYVMTTLVFLLFQAVGGTQDFSLVALTLALGLTHWMIPARILRGQTQRLLASDFVFAARSLGASSLHILRTHLPAHLRKSFFVLLVLQIPTMLVYESFMSFIGFGVSPPGTSWGLLLQEGWRYLGDYPHLLLAPGLVLFNFLIVLNYLFDGIGAPPKATSNAWATEIPRWSAP